MCAGKDAFVLSKVYLAQTFALAKLATYAAMKIPENSDACLKQTLDQVSMKQKTSTGSHGNWTTMTNVS
jgi:hypothetical protein